MAKRRQYAYGERLKLIRLGAGLTQREFGEKFGYSRSSISDIERGITLPHIRFWISLAIQFKVSLDVLILFRDEGTDPKETFRRFASIKQIRVRDS